MDEKRATELLAKWDEIISPLDCDELLFWLSSWLADKEEELTTDEGIVAQQRLALVEAGNSVAKADVILEAGDVYQIMKACERGIRRLKSARNNVRRRYEILIGNNTTFKKY